MNLRKDVWTKEDYLEYVDYLKSLGEEEYKRFHSKLTFTHYEILGIRVPTQRKIAKEIGKGNALSFLQFCGNTYYEEVNIEGFVIAGLKEESEKYFDSFLLKIDNWAICDGFCNSVKIKEEQKNYYFEKIKKLLQSNQTFVIRVGLVLFLSHYVTEDYICEILQSVEEISSDEYYVNMAMAWLIAECFIRYPKEIEPFLKHNSLNPFTQNKTISKIRDSYRVKKEVKEMLIKYRK